MKSEETYPKMNRLSGRLVVRHHRLFVFHVGFLRYVLPTARIRRILVRCIVQRATWKANHRKTDTYCSAVPLFYQVDYYYAALLCIGSNTEEALQDRKPAAG